MRETKTNTLLKSPVTIQILTFSGAEGLCFASFYQIRPAQIVPYFLFKQEDTYLPAPGHSMSLSFGENGHQN